MSRGLWPAIRRLGPRLHYAAIAAVALAGVAGLIAPLVDSPSRVVPHTVQARAEHVVHQHEDTAGDSLPIPRTLAAQLAIAKRVALRWPTVRAALADGWTLAAP